jgi:(E)-4-hydroxy-3-methyl-but-2-enyl pyrophosphate reductase (IPP and DMAPP forming)
MKVKPITPRGYCMGVIRAIQMVKKSTNLPKPIYILGMIVHNQYIVNAFSLIGIKTIDKKGATRLELLEEIDQGTVVITAHGASKEVFEKAKEKGLYILDATCPDVVNTHNVIKEYLTKGYDILYIGKKGHPEAEGSIAIDPSRIHLITTKKDINRLSKSKKYVITNQTTMSLYDVFSLCEYADEQLPHLLVIKETCNATKVRQEAIASLDDDIDVIFIVGDPNSHNSKKLASIAHEKSQKQVYLIESVKDITVEMLKDKTVAAVSSGASTPTYLTKQVIAYLENFDIEDVATHSTPDIDFQKII